MARAGLALAVLTGLAVAGCIHTNFTRTDFTRTAAVVPPSRSPDCHLEIAFSGPPRRPYVVLGQVWTDSSAPQILYGRFDTNAAPIQRLIQRACVAGAHGLMSVVVETHGPWLPKGWKSTRAAAVAFVYVDASGRLLPAPSGPQVEIPVSDFGP